MYGRADAASAPQVAISHAARLVYPDSGRRHVAAVVAGDLERPHLPFVLSLSKDGRKARLAGIPRAPFDKLRANGIMCPSTGSERTESWLQGERGLARPAALA